MNNVHIFRYLLILFVTSGYSVILAQNTLEEKNYYKWFDQNIGQDNTDLFNGEIYIKTFRTENKNHNFFINNDYVLGTVMFNNQLYYDIPLKYEIYEDELIANLKNSYSGESIVQLNKAFIKEFSIYNKDFKFLNVAKESIVLNGFYEVIYNGSILKLYTKHRKLKGEYISQGIRYNKFSEKEENVVLFKNNYYEINSKKDLKNAFPNQKKEINNLYKKNKHLKKSDNNAFIRNIIQQLEQYL